MGFYLLLLIRPKNVENISANLSFNLDQHPAYSQHLASLIPNNIFAPFSYDPFLYEFDALYINRSLYDQFSSEL